MMKEGKTPLTPEEETLMLVRKLWRAEKWRRFWAAFKYVIFILILAGGFYILTPYVEQAVKLLREFQSIKSPEALQKFLERFQK